jgi:hypothetical protein
VSLRQRLDRVERALPRLSRTDALDRVLASLSDQELLDLVGWCNARARGEAPSAVQRAQSEKFEERCRAAGVRLEDLGH